VRPQPADVDGLDDAQIAERKAKLKQLSDG